MPDEALMDAPLDDVAVDDAQIYDSGADPGSSEDPAQTETDTQTQDDSAPVISDANGQLKLSEKTRAELDRIKADNPKLARELRAAVFDRHLLLSKIPGGVKEALATIEAYEAEGGSEAVQQIKEELGQWKDVDAEFQAGDGRFAARLAESNPEAFTKLAPSVLNKFSEIAPEAFSHHISKIFAQDMANNDVILTMRLFQREIAALPEESRAPVQQLWQQLASYVDRINKHAQTPPKQEAKTAAANPAGNSELEQREQAITLREFGSERSRVLSSVTDSEFKKNLGGRKASETQISAIRELYETRLDKILRADTAHTSKVDRFLAAKDKAGYAKHMAAIYRAKAPLAMEQAFKAVMPGKPGPVVKPATKSVTANVQTDETTGWTRVAAKPASSEIAHWKMTTKMLKEGKYILRNGKQVIFNG